MMSDIEKFRTVNALPKPHDPIEENFTGPLIVENFKIINDGEQRPLISVYINGELVHNSPIITISERVEIYYTKEGEN